jgi:hypothetical protein
MGSPISLRPIIEASAAAGVARSHAVINALIEELPPIGTTWPGEQRVAWLELMSTAFTLAYGAAGVATRSASSPAARPRPAKAKTRRAASRKPAKPTPLGPTGPRFFVDAGNFARRAGGARIMPSDDVDELVDQRGMNGDLGTITWADDSTGIPKGVQINVTIG